MRKKYLFKKFKKPFSVKTKKESDKMPEALDSDFYAVEIYVDGFGNDTYVNSIWKTEAEAREYASKTFEEGEAFDIPNAKEGQYVIVKGKFGENLKCVF